jgi:phosphoribosylformimino-5-aminoimidazole carboxamide ribotide isomerase
VNTPVIASGGVSTLDDLRTLRTLHDDGVVGAVIGRALYEGGLAFGDCLKAIL